MLKIPVLTFREKLVIKILVLIVLVREEIALIKVALLFALKSPKIIMLD